MYLNIFLLLYSACAVKFVLKSYLIKGSAMGLKRPHFSMHESSYCFLRILAISVLSVHLSVTRVDQSKIMQAKITESLPSAG